MKVAYIERKSISRMERKTTMENNGHRQRWLMIILFILIVTIDWMYIRLLCRYATIIIHWVIISPIIMTLFFVLSLATMIGIYLNKPWGFVSSYLIITFSVIFSIISFQIIPRDLFIDTFYITLLVILNTIIFFTVLFFQIRGK